jgi:hypothetical protein
MPGNAFIVAGEPGRYTAITVGKIYKTGAVLFLFA